MRPILAAALAVSIAVPAWGHDAPSGWTYDPGCCSDRDCAMVPFGQAQAAPGGWRVRLDRGDHHYFDGSLDVTIPYGDSRIRRSGDTEFHICLTSMGHVLCLYVPPMGG